MISGTQLLARVLSAGGVDEVYGAPLVRPPHSPNRGVSVADPQVAALLAAAHVRVHGAPAAVHSQDGLITIKDGPIVEVDRAADLVDAVGASRLRLNFDLAAPAPDVVPSPLPPADAWQVPADIDRLAAAAHPVALVGPGVTPAVPGLHALAAAADLGVLNTWGAKGVFDWRSRHHWATVGLQARDFELAGLADADLILAVGLDPREAPPDRWHLAPVLTMEPAAMGPAAEVCRRPRGDLRMPPLRTGLAAVTQAGWESTSAPMAPSRVTRAYGAASLVAADPGTAGYWVARTFGTVTLGSVQVPADPAALGFAPACALVARLRRPAQSALAVVDGPPADVVGRVLEAAATLGVAVPLEVWDPAGPTLTADAHEERLRRLLVDERPAPVAIATDASQLDRMIDVAGEVVAWR